MLAWQEKGCGTGEEEGKGSSYASHTVQDCAASPCHSLGCGVCGVVDCTKNIYI